MIERIKPELQGVKVTIDRLIQDIDPLIRPPIEQTVQNKGKLLRPMLLVLTAKCGDYDKKSAVLAATALELVHIASLIHDDIVDDGANRRGAISVQSKFGKDAAVYAGDYILAESIRLLSQLDDMTLISMYASAMGDMCQGELKQHACRHTLLTTQEYIQIITDKTGVLFGLSLEAGGHIAGLEETVCAKLSDIGKMVGIAYQIYDDCLDYTFTKSEALKDTHKDMLQGNYTAPLLCALERDKSGTLKDLLNTPITDDVIAAIQDTVRKLGGPEVAMQHALDYFNQITERTCELSRQTNVDFSELVTGLHGVINTIKSAIS